MFTSSACFLCGHTQWRRDKASQEARMVAPIRTLPLWALQEKPSTRSPQTPGIPNESYRNRKGLFTSDRLPTSPQFSQLSSHPRRGPSSQSDQVHPVKLPATEQKAAGSIPLHEPLNCSRQGPPANASPQNGKRSRREDRVAWHSTAFPGGEPQGRRKRV